MIHRGLWFLKMLLPCFHPVAFRGKVAREARRKGPLPSLSVFTALTEITAKTPPSRQTEPPPLGSRLRSNRATPSQGGGVLNSAFIT